MIRVNMLDVDNQSLCSSMCTIKDTGTLLKGSLLDKQVVTN
jgi:hypothetical protein